MFGINKLQIYGLIVASFVLGLLGIYSAGIARGKDKIKRKLDEKLIDNMKTAKEVEDEIESLGDNALLGRADKWVRKDNE
jgi:hypothetical protein